MNLSISRKRLSLWDQLGRELATIYQKVQVLTELGQLKQDYPDFKIWSLLSGTEQRELLLGNFKPRQLAADLVLREYMLTSIETLRYDRKKLRKATRETPRT